MSKTKRQRCGDEFNPTAALSFVRDDAPWSKHDKKRCFWRVLRTGDYGLDCKLGESLGREALDHMHKHDMPFLLNWIVGDMIRAGRFGGVEVGFLSIFSHAALGADCHEQG
jgi:hypothetical protein